jgi:hypothetical protein
MIDSLNEKELAKGLTITKENPKGIDKLEEFLIVNGLTVPEMIKFLRKLQALRSTGIAHRKGKRYKKIKKYFNIDNNLPTVFEEITIKCIQTLSTLQNFFLSGK